MQLYALFGAGLVALLIMAWPALTQPQFRTDEHFRLMHPFAKGKWGALRDLVQSELGVTITYLSKFGGNGTSTAPTAIEANFLPIQTAQVFVADSDTEVQLVHNWGGALGPSFTSFGFPVVIINKLLGTGASFRTDWTIGLANSNKVFLTKPVGSFGGTFLVTLFLPSSLAGGRI